MNNLDIQYQELLKTIMKEGVVKKDRTGTGTKSIFGYQIRHNMQEGFPLLTTKKMHFKGIVTELLWFLRGDTNIKYLLDNNCNIWTGDAYKNYTKHTSGNEPIWNKWMRENPDGTLSMFTQDEFVVKIKTDEEFWAKWGYLGPIYGKQWRDWRSVAWEDQWRQVHDSVHNHYDQIANLVNDLKNNPDSRRMMVNAWNVGEIDQAVLPPCHYGFQIWTRELTTEERYNYWFTHNYEIGFERDSNKEIDFENPYWVPTPKRAISLMWNQRSVDTFLGLPFNIASYGLLLEILGREVDMIPETLIGNLGDTHLYLNHLDQAQAQCEREPFNLPRLIIDDNVVESITNINYTKLWSPAHFNLSGYMSHSTIRGKLSN